MLPLTLAAGRPLRLALLGAHCDDVEIGCGGVLLDLVDRGALERVDVLVASSTPQRERECRASLAGFLGQVPHAVRFGGLPDGRLPGHWDETKTLLQEFAVGTRADAVFAPAPQDAHQDHRLLGELVRTAFRDHLVLHYEIPKWDGDLGASRPQVHWPLTEDLVRRKFALLDEHYASQRGHDWWNADTFAALSRLRGVECRSPHAEAFSCSTLVLQPGTTG